MTSSKTYIVNDQATETDALDFTPYVETLADIIQTGNTPLTIGVFGTWGSGKTSLMKMVKNKLPDDFTVAWFDAWKYDKEETLWRAFLLSVLSAVKETSQKQGKPTEEFEKMQSLLYREMELEKVGGVIIDLPKLGGAVATGLVKLSLSFIPGISALTKLVEELQSGTVKSGTDDVVSAITRERTKIYIEQVKFLEQFQEKFAKLIKTHIAPKRLVVFVDDLDRCLPEKAIEVLEAIKLFLDVKDCIFMLGLDQEVIARGIEMKYKELGARQDGDTSQQHFTIEGVRYLEKIIQLPFLIPPIEQSDMSDFVENLSSEWPHEECPKIFSIGLGDNPRQIKRTVNVFLMLWKLAEKRKEKLQGRIKPILLAKVVAIQSVYPELYEFLKKTPRYLRELEDYYMLSAVDVNKKESIITETAQDEITSPAEPLPALAPYISRESVRRILGIVLYERHNAHFREMSVDDLRLYFTLTRRTEAPQSTPTINTERSMLEPQMIRIPAGEFLMGTTLEEAEAILKEKEVDNNEGWQLWLDWQQPQHTVVLSEYSISKYPITNQEYHFFVQETNHITPRGWDGAQFPAEKGDHPVSNISWNDAVAYCNWISIKSGKQFRLPTEAEWEKAARGKNGLVYPWGNEFNHQRANTEESEIGDTNEVGQFSPKGDSPYGCADMVGNVWEWCIDWFDVNEYKNRKNSIKDPYASQKGDSHVLRGGSFIVNCRIARCAFRYLGRPDISNLTGFRVVLSTIKLESED